MMMPMRAITPKVAMNPIGVLVASIVATIPISPSGATLITSKTRWKLWSCIINRTSMMISMTGTTATTDAWARALSSTMPPTSML